MSNYAQGSFLPKNPEKYVGRGQPRYRSGWEHSFFIFCDQNPNVTEWASEAISIKYRHPFTGQIKTYVPDIFMRYRDQNNQLRTEIIEIKPRKQSMIEGKMNEHDRAVVAVNHAKWHAARAWCQRANIEFRVLTEDALFRSPGKKR